MSAGKIEHNYTPLVSELKSGPYLVTISQVAKLRNTLGEVVLYKGNNGVVITFKTDEGKYHQELYWIGGLNYSKLLKLLRLIGAGITRLDKREVIGKRLCIVIKTIVTLKGGFEINRKNVVEETVLPEKKDRYPSFNEEYINE